MWQPGARTGYGASVFPSLPSTLEAPPGLQCRASWASASSCRAWAFVLWERLQSKRVTVRSYSPQRICNSRTVPSVLMPHLQSSPITCRARQSPTGTASHLYCSPVIRSYPENCTWATYGPRPSVPRSHSDGLHDVHPPLVPFQELPSVPSRPEDGRTGRLGTLLLILLIASLEVCCLVGLIMRRRNKRRAVSNHRICGEEFLSQLLLTQAEPYTTAWSPHLSIVLPVS